MSKKIADNCKIKKAKRPNINRVGSKKGSNTGTNTATGILGKKQHKNKSS